MLWTALCTAALAGSGCGGDDTGATTGGGTSSDDDDDGNAIKKDGGSNMCTTEGVTKSCSCSSGGYGVKKCTKGSYGSCDCSAKSDSGITVSNQDLCKAGYYTGNFKGKYKPGAFGGGFGMSQFEVDISGGTSLFSPDLPPLSFTLTEELSGPVGEFATFSVGNGCMQGVANAVFITQSPFVARITGDLDCATGKFEGTLDGYYKLIGIDFAQYDFKGPLTAQFDMDALQDGVWSVKEPPAINGDPQGGGNGSWDAMWTAVDAPKNDIDPCKEVDERRAMQGGFPGDAKDAGTATSTKDAGK